MTVNRTKLQFAYRTGYYWTLQWQRSKLFDSQIGNSIQFFPEIHHVFIKIYFALHQCFFLLFNYIFQTATIECFIKTALKLSNVLVVYVTCVFDYFYLSHRSTIFHQRLHIDCSYTYIVPIKSQYSDRGFRGFL